MNTVYSGTPLIRTPTGQRRLAVITGWPCSLKKKMTDWCSGRNKVTVITKWPYQRSGRILKAGFYTDSISFRNPSYMLYIIVGLWHVWVSLWCSSHMEQRCVPRHFYRIFTIPWCTDSSTGMLHDLHIFYYTHCSHVTRRILAAHALFWSDYTIVIRFKFLIRQMLAWIEASRSSPEKKTRFSLSPFCDSLRGSNSIEKDKKENQWDQA